MITVTPTLSWSQSHTHTIMITVIPTLSWSLSYTHTIMTTTVTPTLSWSQSHTHYHDHKATPTTMITKPHLPSWSHSTAILEEVRQWSCDSDNYLTFQSQEYGHQLNKQLCKQSYWVCQQSSRCLAVKMASYDSPWAWVKLATMIPALAISIENCRYHVKCPSYPTYHDHTATPTYHDHSHLPIWSQLYPPSRPVTPTYHDHTATPTYHDHITSIYHDHSHTHHTGIWKQH